MITFITHRPRLPKVKKTVFVLTHSTTIGNTPTKNINKTRSCVQKNSTVIRLYRKR